MAANSISPPSRRHAIGKGVLLGIVGALIACTLSAVVFAISMLVSKGPEVFSDYLAGVVLFLTGPAAFIVTGLPAGLAGGVNALLLYNVSRRRKLRTGIALLTGFLVGLFFGFLIGFSIGGVLLLKDPAFGWGTRDFTDSFALGAIVSGASALVGLWHSWRMLLHLQRCGR